MSVQHWEVVDIGQFALKVNAMSIYYLIEQLRLSSETETETRVKARLVATQSPLRSMLFLKISPPALGAGDKQLFTKLSMFRAALATLIGWYLTYGRAGFLLMLRHAAVYTVSRTSVAIQTIVFNGRLHNRNRGLRWLWLFLC